MKIVNYYSFDGGEKAVLEKYSNELYELEKAISNIIAEEHLVKESKEEMAGRLLYSPSSLNQAFKEQLNPLGWRSEKVTCDYVYGNPTDDYFCPDLDTKPFREMDFLKDRKKLGVEVQFGKYAFMVYNVCAKMTIFKNLGYIDTGIEIIPVKNFSNKMSAGVSYFEQFAWDLEKRGVSNIDVPVLILGIDA